MNDSTTLFGTPLHQQITQSVIDHYTGDRRIRAVLVFGSLARGNWDEYSDIDLDVVMRDGVAIDARRELTTLCAFLKREHDLDALIMADAEEGDVVLSNLLQFSIRYHVLDDTKPVILESMKRLHGNLTLDVIRVSADPRYRTSLPAPDEIINQCLRYALELHNAGQRGRFWMASDLLYRIRGLLMALYGVTRGAIRPLQYFEANADPALKALLMQLLPTADPDTILDVFDSTLVILNEHLDTFSADPVTLTDAQRLVLEQLNKLR